MITFLIKEIFEKFGVTSFVETGIGEGSTTACAVKAFEDLKVKNWDISEVQCVALLFIDEVEKLIAEKLDMLPFKAQTLKFFDRRRALVCLK
jgi:hypothetical protein